MASSLSLLPHVQLSPTPIFPWKPILTPFSLRVHARCCVPHLLPYPNGLPASAPDPSNPPSLILEFTPKVTYGEDRVTHAQAHAGTSSWDFGACLPGAPRTATPQKCGPPTWGGAAGRTHASPVCRVRHPRYRAPPSLRGTSAGILGMRSRADTHTPQPRRLCSPRDSCLRSATMATPSVTRSAPRPF